MRSPHRKSSGSQQTTKDGAPTGYKINIPKDLLVKSASVKEVTEADQPYEGAAVGDKYIDFVINSVEGDANESHVYLAVKDLGGAVLPWTPLRTLRWRLC